MAWDFETDAEYQAQLDWAGAFVRDEVEPLDLAFPGQQYVPPDDRRRRVINPLKEEVRKHRLWATHLGPELGGEVFSCYSMTEPDGGSDPTQFKTLAVRDGDDWVINGWKFFSSNARTAGRHHRAQHRAGRRAAG